MTLKELRNRLIHFTKERDWEQFHDPKNLAAGLSVEAAELLELFQWVSTEDSDKHAAQEKERVEEELADVFIYCLMLSERVGIDILDAAARKIEINARKYPVEKARGSSIKSTRLEN